MKDFVKQAYLDYEKKEKKTKELLQEVTKNLGNYLTDDVQICYELEEYFENLISVYSRLGRDDVPELKLAEITGSLVEQEIARLKNTLVVTEIQLNNYKDLWENSFYINNLGVFYERQALVKYKENYFLYTTISGQGTEANIEKVTENSEKILVKNYFDILEKKIKQVKNKEFGWKQC